MIIAVDFDGTVVTHEYPNIGKEIPFAIDTLKRLQTEGMHQLILWTVREGDLLTEAVEFCRVVNQHAFEQFWVTDPLRQQIHLLGVVGQRLVASRC